MNFTFRIWRQRTAADKGQLVAYPVSDISSDLSFLEVIDTINETLSSRGEETIAFDMDCREGICGACSLVINGQPHGPEKETTTCQLYMRHFSDGETITVEPYRADSFPVIRDLVVDRSPLERIIQAGGYISVHTGEAGDANATLIPKHQAELAFEAASCIGCGACVAACPNASAMLFVAAKVTQLALLPQGQPERLHRVIRMAETMDHEGFGNCSNHYLCAEACPKEIPISLIARLNREFLAAALVGQEFLEPPHHSVHHE
ncbi:MAG: succinate dehydrogenase/fumarate reductase iron-sulfur subunit [Gammaproteobacteria bacterium]|nr:succinate dehydrogenase/fumarate reductase iron-sulfur subunit [Gammaproteobacteria bacterium]